MLKQFSNTNSTENLEYSQPPTQPSQIDSRLQINGLFEVKEAKITTNYMEGELMELQSKIAKLESKLNLNQQLNFNKTDTQSSLEKESDRKETNSRKRLEIDLDNHLKVQEVSGSFCSEKVSSATKPIKSMRRSESVALTNRTNVPKIKSNLSGTKQDLNNSSSVDRKPRSSCSKPKVRCARTRDISDSNSRLQS